MSRFSETMTRIESWISQSSAAQCTFTLPPDLPIYRICPVNRIQHDPTYVSMDPGRWNAAGTSMSYFADSVDVCEAELCSNGHKLVRGVLEYWNPRHKVRGFDVRRIPAELFRRLYTGEKADQWQLSQALIDSLRESGRLSGVEVIMAPSAAGIHSGAPGLCFAFWDHNPHLQLRSATSWPPEGSCSRNGPSVQQEAHV